MTQAGTSPPGSAATPATPAAAATTPTPDLTQDLSFGELAAFLPQGVLVATGAGLILNLSALSQALNLNDYGVSQAIYNLILAAEQAQATANAGRLSSKKLNAVVINFTELRGTTIRFGVSLNGHADLVHNLQGIKGGI